LKAVPVDAPVLTGFGTTCVSVLESCTSSMGMFSSREAICTSLMLSPWPISTPPVRTSTDASWS
jgi:hypothetical protein